MLGRLEMDVDECIQEYRNLTKALFAKKSKSFPISWRANVKAQFDSTKLRSIIEEVIQKRNIKIDEKFNNEMPHGCRTSVRPTLLCSLPLMSYKVRLRRRKGDDQHSAAEELLFAWRA